MYGTIISITLQNFVNNELSCLGLTRSPWWSFGSGPLRRADPPHAAGALRVCLTYGESGDPPYLGVRASGTLSWSEKTRL